MSLGGSNTTTQDIPEWLQKASQDALARASAASDIGYTPYMGPEVAAFNTTQEAAFNNNIAMAEDLGLAAPRGPSMPGAQDFGSGVWGYGSYEPYMATMDRFREARPGQAAMIDSFSIDPVTGAPGANTYAAQQQAAIDAEMAAAANNQGGQYGIPAGVYNDRDQGSARDRDLARGSYTSGGSVFEGPNMNGDAGYYNPGGYSGIGDVFDGGGPGQAGEQSSIGGLLSDVGGSFRETFDRITGQDDDKPKKKPKRKSSGGGGK